MALSLKMTVRERSLRATKIRQRASSAWLLGIRIGFKAIVYTCNDYRTAIGSSDRILCLNPPFGLKNSGPAMKSLVI